MRHAYRFALAVLVGAPSAHAGFRPGFPANDPAAIEEVVRDYEAGRQPDYRPQGGDMVDYVVTFGPAAALAASLQLYARQYSAEARKSLILAIGRMGAAAVHLGALTESEDQERYGARQQLGYLFHEAGIDGTDVHAIRLLQSIAKGRRLKSLAPVATEALDTIYKNLEAVVARRGEYKGTNAHDEDDIIWLMAHMFEINERRALLDLKRVAESRGEWAQHAQEYFVYRLAERDRTKLWRACHEALVGIVDKKLGH